MRTFDNHLVGVFADAPHPKGYRLDLPLRIGDGKSEVSDEYSEGYDQGYDDGSEAEAAAARRRAMAVVA